MTILYAAIAANPYCLDITRNTDIYVVGERGQRVAPVKVRLAAVRVPKLSPYTACSSWGRKCGLVVTMHQLKALIVEATWHNKIVSVELEKTAVRLLFSTTIRYRL